MNGTEIFISCTVQSVERFFEDLGMCKHIKKMNFAATDLDEIIYKLGPAMKNNNITHWSVDECYMGVPEVNHMFKTFRDMKSLEYIHIDAPLQHGWNDDIMAGCIQSLAASTRMRKLTLINLNMSTSSCAALSAIFPRMAALVELDLGGNSIDDYCVEVLVRGLAECKHLQSLSLNRNRIGDGGLNALIQGLPASVNRLDINYNQIFLARQLPLLRFKVLGLSGNAISSGSLRVMAASLADPECRLQALNLYDTNIGDEGAATLAGSLRSNQRLTRMYLENNNITESGWKAFSSILCDTTSINATHGSNHALQYLGFASGIPHDVKMLLELNSGEDKSIVAANKILQTHHHLDMRHLFDWEFGLLPYVVAWLKRFAESRLDMKLSSIFEFVRAMPMKVTDRVVGDGEG